MLFISQRNNELHDHNYVHLNDQIMIHQKLIDHNYNRQIRGI